MSYLGCGSARQGGALQLLMSNMVFFKEFDTVFVRMTTPFALCCRLRALILSSTA